MQGFVSLSEKVNRQKQKKSLEIKGLRDQTSVFNKADVLES